MPTVPLQTKVPPTGGDPQQNRQAFVGIRADLARKAQISSSGYILIDSTLKLAIQSPNGHWWTVALANSGALVTTDVGTSPP